ncbi:hypothetical protein SK128_018875 [Halocaridina rubra]|uniref:BTB domain-containing protein n=1 Tax=Halocaridina rubra TaxID=373956 RepID=A0AAN8XFW5_HALRR
MSEYCLRWNNHRPNLVTVFSELLTSEALVDVTLATDGHYIHAHKLVLSACSVYFKDLFGANPCKHPIVILKDIRIDDLKTVIDFIYRGEVNVAQDRLQDVLKTAESLRIKGLAENPRNYDEMSSQGTRFSLSSLGSQVTRQRSSLTDSREQSLSLEGEEEGEPGTPPSSKRRKITLSHDSSESQLDEQENDNINRVSGLSEVKEEPSEDRENDRSHSGDTEQESNVNRVADAMLMLQGASQESAEESGNSAGTSSDPALTVHSQGQGRGKRGVLQRQHGISSNTGGDERREEISSLQMENIKCEIKAERKLEEKVPELIVSDTIVLSGSAVTLTNTQPTLLQVPTMVVGPRESMASGLPKQHSNPTPLLTATPIISKQSSHPEVRAPPKHQGPPPMTKQQSYPSVLTHTPSHSSERIPSTTSSSGTAASASQQHLQVIPMQVFVKQQRQLSTPTPSISSQLRPIQPKPPGENQIVCEQTTKKDIPLIRLTPSEDGAGFGSTGVYSVTGLTGPPRPPRAVSEEPAMTRPSLAHTPELLAPGPSTLVQSISQDSGLDGGLGRRMAPIPQISSADPSPIRQVSAPGHCPVLRGGPALGCNYCWNSTDQQGRVLRRKTKYHCPECRTNLCIVPCFHEYHKQIEKAQDTDKQITKILTKTSSM